MREHTGNIYDYSDPNIVIQRVKQIYGDDIIKTNSFTRSNRKDKKYMMRNPEGKWIHFGQMGYEDYTKHRDNKRRINYLKRNNQYMDADKWTAGYMAYHLLW